MLGDDGKYSPKPEKVLSIGESIRRSTDRVIGDSKNDLLWVEWRCGRAKTEGED
jgi:hypothetical protein